MWPRRLLERLNRLGRPQTWARAGVELHDRSGCGSRPTSPPDRNMSRGAAAASSRPGRKQHASCTRASRHIVGSTICAFQVADHALATATDRARRYRQFAAPVNCPQATPQRHWSLYGSKNALGTITDRIYSSLRRATRSATEGISWIRPIP